MAGRSADIFLEAPSRLELEIKVLQTSALPLGYGAISLAVVSKSFLNRYQTELYRQNRALSTYFGTIKDGGQRWVKDAGPVIQS